jgi:hypothetical protein
VPLEDCFRLSESPINKAAGESLGEILLKELLHKLVAGHVTGSMRWE